MDWIQIGAMAGPTMELPSVALRSANLRIQGNGQGAVSTQAYLAELPSLIEEIDAGTLEVEARPRPVGRRRDHLGRARRSGRAHRAYSCMRPPSGRGDTEGVYCGGFTGWSGVREAKPSTKACTSFFGFAAAPEQSTVPIE